MKEKPTYEQRLRELALQLVTPERFGKTALAPVIELHPPDDPEAA